MDDSDVEREAELVRLRTEALSASRWRALADAQRELIAEAESQVASLRERIETASAVLRSHGATLEIGTMMRADHGPGRMLLGMCQALHALSTDADRERERHGGR